MKGSCVEGVEVRVIQKPKPRRGYGGPEEPPDGLRESDGVSPAIDHGDLGRPLGDVPLRRAAADLARKQSAVKPDQFGSQRGPAPVGQPAVENHRRYLRVQGVRPGDARCLDEQVESVERVIPEELRREILEDVEHLDEACSPSRERERDHLEATVAGPDRWSLDRSDPHEIGFAHVPAVALHVGVDLVGDVSAVKVLRPSLAIRLSVLARSDAQKRWFGPHVSVKFLRNRSATYS